MPYMTMEDAVAEIAIAFTQLILIAGGLILFVLSLGVL